MKILHAAVAGELIERLRHLRPGTPARWGKMNAHQMVCHLNDSYSLAMGFKTASEDVTLINRTLVRASRAAAVAARSADASGDGPARGRHATR